MQDRSIQINHYTQLAEKLVLELSADERKALLSKSLPPLTKLNSLSYRTIHEVLQVGNMENAKENDKICDDLLRKSLERHSAPYLEQLPQGVISIVSGYLDKKNLLNLSLGSKTTCSLFKKPLAGAVKLLHLVQEADYVEAEKMVTADPSLMFQYVHYQKADGTDGIISPLKFAFEIYDTYMWRMFEEKITNDTELMALFTKQAQEQTEHVNLEPLFTRYETYDKNHSLWRSNKISDKTLDQAWSDVAVMQRDRKVLPRHMLKEFCREGDSWSPTSTFDVNTYPAPSDMNIIADEKEIPISTLGLIRGALSKLVRGISSARMRWNSTAASDSPHPLFSSFLGPKTDYSIHPARKYDVWTFRRLHEVRKNDFEKLQSRLKPTSENMKKMKVL